MRFACQLARVALVVSILTLPASACGGDSERSDGPLDGTTGVATFTEGLEPLDVLQWGLVRLSVRSSGGSVELTEIELIIQDESPIEVVGGPIVWGPDRGFGTYTGAGWPVAPNDLPLPRDLGVSGTTIVHGQGDWNVVWGVRLSAEGVGIVEGYKVDYVSGGERFTETFDAVYVLCSRAIVECDVPEELRP